MQAAVKIIKKMLKKTPNKSMSIAFIAAFFAVVLTLDLFGVHFSTIYLILIAGVLGFCLYALPKQKGAQK